MAFLLLSFISLIATSAGFSMSADPAGPDYVWKTTVTLTCTWDPSQAGKTAEFLIDNNSIYGSNSPYDVQDPLSCDNVTNCGGDTSKVEVNTDMESGNAQLIIKDLRASDTHSVVCSVSWLGVSSEQVINVNEPPTTPVSGIATSAVGFNDATVTFNAVEDATKYTVGWKTSTESDWTESDEITDTTYTITGLLVATEYHVRVKAGDSAGYHDDVALDQQTFTTMDNRPPKPVDNISVGSPEYNATTITVTWSMGENTAEGLIVTSITAKVELNNTEVEGSLQTLGSDETEATFTLPGPGNYVFVVSTHNEYSASEDTVAVVAHTVEKTRPPPTPKPTQPPTQPKPTKALECRDPNLDIQYETGEPQYLEGMPGDSVTIECFISNESSVNGTAVEWNFNDDALNNEQLQNQEGFSVSGDENKSSLVISNYADSHKGKYTCKLNSESCSFQITSIGQSVDVRDSAPSSFALSGFLVLAVLLRLL